MTSYIVALLLVALSLLGVLLQKTYSYLPVRELKRQAERGDALASTLFRAAVYEESLHVLLWVWIGLTAAGGFLLLARVAPPIFGFIAVVLLLWIVFAWLPSSRLTSAGAHFAAWCTPTVVWLLNHLHPSFARVGHLVRTAPHSRLYEREDFIELLEAQQRQSDNRIPLEELEVAKRALSFSDYHVRDVVVPRKKVRTVAPDDAVNPVLVDELHDAGHHRFPVYDKANKTVVGVLWLSKLQQLNTVKKGGQVRDYMDDNVVYLHENDTLADALDAFFKTKQQLFVVVNSFEEYVGIVTLDDIVLQLLGAQVSGEFVQFDDKAAVAMRHQKKPEPDTPEEPIETIDPDAEPSDDVPAEAPVEPSDEPAPEEPAPESPEEKVS